MVQTVRRTIENPQLHVSKVFVSRVQVVRVPLVVHTPVVTQRLEIPQLQFIDMVIDFPMCCLGDAWCW